MDSVQASDWGSKINKSVANADQKFPVVLPWCCSQHGIDQSTFSAYGEEGHYLADSQRPRVDATENCFSK
jgi:hypothetical protein